REQNGTTYDANGNTLHDATLNTNYTWDAHGNMVSVGGVAITNDAFGGMVYKNGSYFVGSPIGNLGVATSLTAKKSIRIPLPGGSSIIYDSAGNEQLNRKDFTGSTRLVSNRVARTLSGVFCYGPLGEIYCGTPANAQFEGTFQDTITGLD